MMVQCDKCDVWQHVPCMQLNPSRLPNEYLCELCAPQNHERLLAKYVLHFHHNDFRANLLSLLF